MSPQTPDEIISSPRQRRTAPLLAVERLSELIGGIYDCALDPTKWPATLARINREFVFADSWLGIVPFGAGPHVVAAQAGADPEWVALTDSYRQETFELWGGAGQLEKFPLDEPIVASQTAGWAARESNRYFVDVLKPRGRLHGIGLIIAREPSLFGYVAFDRLESDGEIVDDEVEAMRILGPHFRRAATISNLFDLKTIEASTFAAALDSFAFAVVLVDEFLAIVHANAAARTMLAASNPIRSDKGFIALPSKPAQAALQRAVRLTRGKEAELGARGIGIPLRRDDDAPSVVHVLPLRRGEIGRSLAQRATAALFITPATTPPRAPADALAVLYDLTPAELRVLELIAAGVAPAAIAKTLSIAPSTVKSHVLRIFDKTGCRRQVDLVRLAANLSLPV